ncbi:hypothetical protein TNIN_22951 [Trichonephila inaurata madagascariensis]|uniref:Uncharacterized protein n=1 Tax=Trichonephila inaurata madagascariensis TaxID=2747483 RepID=A0A8X6X8R6_9ARAC|nr:hypothetical protein TNIN_22951 [Trichonephila inaurata madagascariensis]
MVPQGHRFLLIHYIAEARHRIPSKSIKTGSFLREQITLSTCPLKYVLPKPIIIVMVAPGIEIAGLDCSLMYGHHL